VSRPVGAQSALITGPCGQDGTLLARHLRGLGYRVIGIVRPGFRAGPQRISPCDIELVEADICDHAAWSKLLSEHTPQEIYHLAACHHSTRGGTGPQDHQLKKEMVNTNFFSTKALAFAVLEAGSHCHLIYAGSSQMYSAESLHHEIDERAERKPSTFYGYTKAWSMELLVQLRKDCGLMATTAILFNHESPLRRPQFVSRKISQAAAAASRGDPVNLDLLNIGARADWSSANDVVRALHLMATADRPADFVIASGELHSVRAMLDIAFGHVGLDWNSLVTVQCDVEEPALVGNATLLESTLGWKRQQTFPDMIRHMVNVDIASRDHAHDRP
jgi:GDPmannose 4,6-dehydratase